MSFVYAFDKAFEINRTVFIMGRCYVFNLAFMRTNKY